jgi:lipoprotein-anchoring transpeptidase ErfK/SrfK
VLLPALAETPTGVFTTKLKDKDHHSSIYHNAAMPYTQRNTNDGVALHAGGVPGYPDLHGCVHLPSEYARLLFDAAPLGMTIVIADYRTQPEFVD